LLLWGCLGAYNIFDKMEAASAKIKKQVEFYFSDSNIVKDAFLKSKVESTEGGWVAASLLASFKRVKEMLKEGGVEEANAAKFICDAVNGVEDLEVDNEKLQIRRKNPIPEKTDADARTIYVKGWPRDPEPTLEAVSDFYTAQGVKVLCVRLRRSEYGRYRGHFKGTLTVELATVEQAKELLEKKPRPEGGAEEMIYQDYATFAAEKAKEEAERAAARATQTDAPAAKRPRKDESGAEVTVTEKPEPHKPIPNSVVRITGMPANLRGKETKLELLKIAEVLFVEIEGDDKKEVGDEEEKKKEEEKKEVVVIARCKDERNSNKLVEELNSKGFHDVKVQASLLQGAEEEAFWEKALAAMNAADGSYSHRGRGGKRGGRGRGRGRGRH